MSVCSTFTDSKTTVILQSNYIPWRGYFDLIGQADVLILYDTVQYTRRDWRNRNQIKTAHGPHWLTIPVEAKGQFEQKIGNIRIANPQWTKTHWETLKHAYAKAPNFPQLATWLEWLYLDCQETHLSKINYRFLMALMPLLNIKTQVLWSQDLETPDIEALSKTDRLVALCQQVQATQYLSGPAARSYIDETLFTQAGLALRWMHYPNYPTYTQCHPQQPFLANASIIDVLLNCPLESLLLP